MKLNDRHFAKFGFHFGLMNMGMEKLFILLAYSRLADLCCENKCLGRPLLSKQMLGKLQYFVNLLYFSFLFPGTMYQLCLMYTCGGGER